MPYLTSSQIASMGFKSVGNNVSISCDARIYDCSTIELADNIRVDDFCLLSGRLKIGSYTHLAPYTMLAGGKPGIIVGRYVTFAYGVKVFSESDDYSGSSAVGSLVSDEFKNVSRVQTSIGQFCILGANSVVMPGCNLQEGVALGACSLVNKPLNAWHIYIGQPAIPLKPRSKNIVSAFDSYLMSNS